MKRAIHIDAYFTLLYKSNDSFDKVERYFGIVAVFGNDVDRNFVLSTKFTSPFKLNMLSLFRLCRKDEVERCFDTVCWCGRGLNHPPSSHCWISHVSRYVTDHAVCQRPQFS